MPDTDETAPDVDTGTDADTVPEMFPDSVLSNADWPKTSVDRRASEIAMRVADRRISDGTRTGP